MSEKSNKYHFEFDQEYTQLGYLIAEILSLTNELDYGVSDENLRNSWIQTLNTNLPKIKEFLNDPIAMSYYRTQIENAISKGERILARYNRKTDH